MAPKRHPPPNTLATRAAFFAREQAGWDALVATWDGLPDEALLQAEVGGAGWSVRDVWNHLAAWQEAAARVIGDLQAGRWGQLGMNTERFNAQQRKAARARPSDESRDRLLRARQTLLAQLATLSDEQLLNEYGRQQPGWWARWTTYAHYEEHLADLRAFRERYEDLLSH